MQAAIKKCEDIIFDIKSLNFGNDNKANAIRDELLEVAEKANIDANNHKTQLQDLQFESEQNSLSKEHWQLQQSNLLQIANSMLQDLVVNSKKIQKENKKQTQIDNLELEISRLKSNYEKDIILERNNYHYLKKKYDILKNRFDLVEKEYKNSLGSKKRWNTYLLLAFPLVFFILFFDVFIYSSAFYLLKFKVLVKSSLAFAVISGLLYIPLKEKVLLLLPAFFILIIFILQLF